MNAISKQGSQPYGITISDIVSTSERIIRVRLADSGKVVPIRRDLADFHGDMMFVPYWLAEKLLDIKP